MELSTMNRNTIDYLVDIGLLITIMTSFTTGLIKWPGLIQFFGLSFASLPMGMIVTLHDWSGLFLGLLSIAHIILHWKWIVTMTRKFSKSI
jgi:sugar phosphate permease